MSGLDSSDASPESFSALVENVVVNGFIALNLAIGSRLRLFDALADACASGPVTSAQLAEKTGLKERYLREWLAGMACGRIVDFDSSTGGFYLAPHKLQVVRSSPTFRRFLGFAEGISSFGSTQEHVLSCFSKDGPPGIPYSVCSSLFGWLSRRQPVKFTAVQQESLLSQVPDLVSELSRGVSVADFGCGSGGAIKVLAKMFPASSFCGLDLIEECLADARASNKDLSNVSFRQADLCDIPNDLHGQFDVVVAFDVLHDLPYPEKFLDAIMLALRPGGRLLLNEVEAHSELKDNMGSKFCAALYCMSLHYCMPTSLNAPGGRGLGACGGAEVYQQLLDKCGLVDIRRVQPKEGGLYFYARKPPC